jgi:hypothetical protein
MTEFKKGDIVWHVRFKRLLRIVCWTGDAAGLRVTDLGFPMGEYIVMPEYCRRTAITFGGLACT